MAGIRPVLVTSRLEDPPEKVGFVDDHWVRVPGGKGTAEATDEAIYLTIALRNVGNGLAVLDRWDFYPERQVGDASVRPIEQFHRLTRDLYIAANDRGFWQGAFRDPDSDEFKGARKAIDDRQTITIDVMYGDHEGGQHTISRFALLPYGDANEWMAVVSRHWNLDRDDPR